MLTTVTSVTHTNENPRTKSNLNCLCWTLTTKLNQDQLGTIIRINKRNKINVNSKHKKIEQWKLRGTIQEPEEILVQDFLKAIREQYTIRHSQPQHNKGS